jgi:hypothetical protein
MTDDVPSQDPRDLTEQLRDAQAAVKASRGALLLSEIRGVARTHRVFSGNERELLELLRQYQRTGNTLHLWDRDDPERFDEFLNEVDRLLHNFLSAAATLRDHTRNLWQEYPSGDTYFASEYVRRRDEAFKNSTSAQFVQNLRNYLVHRRLPFIEGTITIQLPLELTTARMFLRRDELLAWRRWSPKARAYLRAAEEQIDLESVIAEYATAVHSFTKWFAEAWRAAHSVVLDELVTLQREVDRLKSKDG